MPITTIFLCQSKVLHVIKTKALSITQVEFEFQNMTVQQHVVLCAIDCGKNAEKWTSTRRLMNSKLS